LARLKQNRDKFVSIRFKVILPYLLLTLIVAITGVYVVTKLVANTLNERLTNQLLEAGRVVSDGMARQEVKHIQVARFAAFTTGLGEALQKGDHKTVATRAIPVAGGLDAENLILINLQGQELLHLIKGSDRTFQEAVAQSGAGNWPFVQSLLKSNDTQSLPQRGIGLNPVNKRYYYYSAIPIALNDAMVGVVVVGTSLDTLLSTLKSTSLADLTFYGENGLALGTTLAGQENGPGFLKTLGIAPDLYQKVVDSENIVNGENFITDGRWYSLARGSLRVSGDRLGAFGVILPLDFVVTSGAISRNTYIILFAIAMIAVILVGYLISRLIINPLYLLMRTSQAIAGGDLTQRTGVRSKDEIGTLANTFDEMTDRLQERSIELERANHILEQMDKTKESFISVSAHELRTPLTLIQGYSQMLQVKTDQYSDLKQIAKGLVEGSDRMAEVVNNMLDVTRIDSNMLKPLLDKIPISRIMERVRDTFEAGLVERKLTLVTAGLDQLPEVPADPDLMYKVFYHLVMNAIKYTPDGGQITVSGKVVEEMPGKREMEIVVSDTGIGIDSQHHELVFEKFYQTGELKLHSSGRTKFKGGGPGLGLAIVHGIVEAHHGRVWVESAGHDEKNYPGSRFYLRLPMYGAGEK
jgi:signal transduction histidine kinase